MPIDSITPRTQQPPDYQTSMRTQPRSTDSMPPPTYEFAPAYTEKPSSAPSRQASSEPATSLTANRIANPRPMGQAMRGMGFMSGL